MHWEWVSKQGTSTADNRDAGGILIKDRAVFAIIVDGSSKGDNGAKFVTQWIKLVIDRLAQVKQFDLSCITESMKQAHRKLRTDYLTETACYSALLILNNGEQAWGICCGDCRIGKKNGDSNIWLNEPHTLANVFHDDLEESCARDIVTRCLKSSRFTEPEIIQLEPSPNAGWILATDGYWLNDEIENANNERADDSSYLRRSHELSKSKINSDCLNWYERFA